MSEASTSAANALKDALGDGIAEIRSFRGETTALVTPDTIRDALAFCKNSLAFDYLVDICSVDNMGEDPRFEVVYELYSFKSAARLRLKTTASEDNPEVPTVSDLWPTANWHEREIWDMMGIRFKGHPDLRRILMWEGYPFHPLRKEFPLAGKPSDMPDVAFTGIAPLEGGPFVTNPSTAGTVAREPRAKSVG